MPTTALPVTLSSPRVAPGSFLKIRYSWEATEPLMRDNFVSVHFVNDRGEMIAKDDHGPSVITGSPGWRGKISYERRVVIPSPLPDCTCRISIALQHSHTEPPGWKLEDLETGPGTRALGRGRVDVGQIIFDNQAPRAVPDTQKPASLDLKQWRMTFNEDFSKPLDISPWGPGTRWITHTPWDGDFGDAVFVDPKPGFPFVIENGILRIEARKDETLKDKWNRKWEAGLIATNDPQGNGFSQKYGYFECRAKMPVGAGVWPAFWLSSSFDRTDPKGGDDGSVEIDVIEYYGHSPGCYQAAVHVWQPAPHTAEGSTVTMKLNEATDDFHRYGVRIEPDFITMYFDGIEVWKTPTPPQHKKPLMMLVNLALGSGWPIDQVPNPSYMYVDYVRAYDHT